ncbi:uncharacterized protein LOC141833955 [Curcuma longa]|uniref:uncharacterized protein LOC141833955 n=1 Tax=Curcuma longa TaxID=136217 RepID=UPI003D9E1CD1
MHVLEKLDSCGAIPITVSDSKGYLLDEDGFDYMKISLIRDIKLQQKSLREYLKSNPRAKYFEDAKPWSERSDIAFPCASQNKIDHPDAIALVNSGCRVLVEGSNMPCTPQAIDILRKAKVLVAPAKAASAGGCYAFGDPSSVLIACKIALVHGGNICAFLNIAHAMIDQGCV